METFDEVTRNPIESPDLSLGCLYLHLDVYENEDGTYTSKTVQLYHRYTDEEKEKLNPSQIDRIEAQAFYTAMMTDTLLG